MIPETAANFLSAPRLDSINKKPARVLKARPSTEREGQPDKYKEKT